MGISISIVYTWYMPCIYRRRTYTWNIHGIYRYIPTINLIGVPDVCHRAIRAPVPFRRRTRNAPGKTVGAWKRWEWEPRRPSQVGHHHAEHPSWMLKFQTVARARETVAVEWHFNLADLVISDNIYLVISGSQLNAATTIYNH